MAFLGANDLIASKRGIVYPADLTIVTDASFLSGNAAKMTTGAQNSPATGICFDNSNNLTGSYTFRAWCEFKSQSMTANLVGNKNSLFLLDNKTTLDAAVAAPAGGAGGWLSVGFQSSDASGNPTIVIVWTDGATLNVGSNTYALTAATRYTIELEVSQTDATHTLCKVYVDGTLRITETLATSAFNNYNFRRALTGMPYTFLWAKGTSVEWRFGAVLAADSVAQSGTDCDTLPSSWGATGPLFGLRLPSGDKTGETDWTSSGGGAGVYTNWNEASGAWTTGDTSYNQAPGTASKKQGSTLPSTAVTAADVTAGVSVIGIDKPFTDAVTNLTFDIPDGTGSSAKTPYKEASGSSTGWGELQQHWNAPASGSWSVTALNTLWVRLNETSTDTPSIYSLYELDVYYTPASTFTPNAAALVGSGVGIV